MNAEADADPLSTSRGFVNGLVISLAFWLGVIVTVAAVIVLRALH